MSRRRLVSMAIGSAAVLASGSAIAADFEFYTGDTLYADCSAKPDDAGFAARHGRCFGYVLGVSDTQQAGQGAGGQARVCMPPAAASSQLVDAASRFLAAHPAKRGLAAQDLVLEALSAQFPCK